MAVRVLGPLDVGSEALGPRERTILAALIVRRGSTVHPAELADAWWGEQPPATWSQQVRNSISRIRVKLGRDAVQTVATEYRLGVDPETIDAVRFERLVSSARALGLQGEDDRAVDAYRRALGMWRGAPLQDVASWEPGIAEAQRLLEIRSSAEEELLDARLRTGEHRAILPDAERLVREQPMREDRWAILALANYRAGRQAEALATIRAARERLADELGIEPGERLASLETAVLRQDPTIAAPTPTALASADCPYPGLRAFGPQDSELFFGRENDAEAVIDRLRPGSVVAIAGASGTGKSSLALAGVAPRLQAGGRVVETVTPGQDAASHLRAAGERANVVVLDQAEELLTLDDDEKSALARAASDIASSGGAVLFTVRSDALDALRALPFIGDALGQGIYLLGPVSVEGCRQAIEEPARHAGLRIEPGLTELALRDLGDRSSTLPYFSHALRETWRRREGNTLTVAGYEASGGIAGAIAQTAESLYRSLAPVDQEQCRTLLLRLIDRGEDGTCTRRRIPSAHLLAEPDRRRVLEELARARLVTIDESSVMVAHEAIVTAWPRLDGWITESADRTRMLRAVESAAQTWTLGGRYDEDLLRGARLHAMLEWRESSQPDLTMTEREFLDASEAQEEEEIRAIAERARRHRRQNRGLWWALSGAAVLLVVALVAGGLAVTRGQEATASAEQAGIVALLATSAALRGTDRTVAALLAAEAYRRWPDDARVRGTLLGTMTASEGLVRTWELGDEPMTMAPIPGTRTALLIVDTNPPQVWIVDLDSGERVRELTAPIDVGDTRFGRSIAISDDGRTAVVQTPFWAVSDEPESCCANGFTFIDLTTGERLPGSQVHEVRTTGPVLISPDGMHAFVGHPLTGDLLRVDAATGELTASSPRALGDFTGQPGELNAVAWLNDGSIAIGGSDAVIQYDPETLEVLARHSLPSNLAGFAVAADGRSGVVSAGPDGLARLDADTGEILWRRGLPEESECWNLAVEPLTDTIYCGQLGIVRTLSLETGDLHPRVLPLHLDTTGMMTLLPDSSELFITTGEASSLWRTDGSGAYSTLVAARHVLGGDFGAGDREIVTMSMEMDGSEKWWRWDVTTDAAVGVPAEHLYWITDAILERFDAGAGMTLENAGSRATVKLADRLAEAVAAHDGWSIGADPGPHGYLVLTHGLAPFDPATGEPAGRILTPPWGGDVELITVSQSADAARTAITWFNPFDQRTHTTVFDSRSGKVLADGLLDSEGSLFLPSGELLVVRDTALTRVDPESLEPLGSLPKPFGGGTVMQLASDGRTLLVNGWDNRASLYDLQGGVLLGDRIETESPILAEGAHLSSDGRWLAAGADGGVLIWDLDPALHARAACAMAGRELTDVEWRTYFGDDEKVATCTELTS
jgi:DNA-binding SARP family transcriptional activator